MYEAVFHVAGEGAYEQATDGTGTTIELWCNDHCDLLQVSGSEGDRVVAEVTDTVGIRERLARDGEQVLITEDCLKQRLEENIEQYLARHGCLLVPPLTYAAGEKRARVLALEADALAAFYDDLTAAFDVSVASKRAIKSVTPDSPFLPVDALLPSLSPRQREVFRAAHEAGYYELPRETSTAAVAETVGVERRTAEEHLRLAEKRLFDAIGEYV